MNKYTCYNCKNFSSEYIKDIKRHYNLKKKCKKTETSLLYSNDQILLLSLFPDNYINETDIYKFRESTVLSDNNNEIFNLLTEKNINRCKTCNFCNKNFNDKLELRKHILLNCFIENINKKNTEKVMNHDCRKIDCNITDSYNTNNFNSPVTINNINNNIININMKCPLSFNNDWDTTHIDFNTLNSILISNHLVMTYLEEILKNDNNLNVILDNNDADGLVFDESKYIKMRKEEITDKTMDKINNDITKFLEDDERKEKIVKKYLDDTKERLEKKIVDFKNDIGGVKKLVVDVVSKIYTTKRINAIEICNNLLNNEIKPTKIGF